MTPIFPNIMTIGKLVRNKTPESILKSIDALENRYGKLAFFKADELVCAPEDVIKNKKTFSKLVAIGLIEAEDGSKTIPHKDRKYRLTPRARKALKYV